MGLKKYVYKGKLYMSRNKDFLMRRLSISGEEYRKLIIKVPWNYKPLQKK